MAEQARPRRLGGPPSSCPPRRGGPTSPSTPEITTRPVRASPQGGARTVTPLLSTSMRLSTMLTYGGDPRAAAEQVAAFEAAGLDMVWVAEAYGFDSRTLMGYLAARTSPSRSDRRSSTSTPARRPCSPRPPRASTASPAAAPHRPGCLRTAGRRGLARRALRPAVGRQEVVEIMRAALRREAGRARRPVLRGAAPRDRAPASASRSNGTRPRRPPLPRRPGPKSSRAPRRTPTAGCRSSTRPRTPLRYGATRSPPARPRAPRISRRWRSWPVAWWPSEKT